jgi:hypothetical protein
LGHSAPDSKRQHDPKLGDTTPSGNDFNGMLVYTGTDMMLTISELNLSLHLCATRQ